MSGRIAIVSDIHGNLPALQAFLAFLDRECPVDAVFNLGDFLQMGPRPAETLDLLLGDPRFLHILGNNEESLLNREPSAFGEEEWRHQDWVLKQIGDRIDRIRIIPRSRIANWAGHRFLLTHEGLSGLLFDQMRLDDYRTRYRAEDAEVVLYGHSHHRSLIETPSGGTFLNPGALGFSQRDFRLGIGSFAIAEKSGSSLGFRFHQVLFDPNALLRDMEEQAVPDRETFWKRYLG